MDGHSGDAKDNSQVSQTASYTISSPLQTKLSFQLPDHPGDEDFTIEAIKVLPRDQHQHQDVQLNEQERLCSHPELWSPSHRLSSQTMLTVSRPSPATMLTLHLVPSQPRRRTRMLPPIPPVKAPATPRVASEVVPTKSLVDRATLVTRSRRMKRPS